MRHKTKIDYEDGVRYRIDDPACTCRNCLLAKLEKSEKKLKTANEDLDELIERPESEKSKWIRGAYKMMKQFRKSLSDAFWFGSLTNNNGQSERTV